MTTCTAQEFRLWQDYIYRHSGILLGGDKSYLIEHRLGRLLKDHGCRNFRDLYLLAHEARRGDPLHLAIIDAMTTHETSWFRDAKLFDFLGSEVLPRLHQQVLEGSRQRVRIWSAACSTGQEPYSMAMAALEAYRALGGDEVCRGEVSILASDISPRAVAAARTAAYDAVSLGRGLGAERKERFFFKDEGKWVLKDEVRAMVEFRSLNLREPFSGLGPFDLVFLRNVIIYFSDEFKRELFARLGAVMAPGALLFLGTGEALSQYSKAFEVMEDHRVVHYRWLGGVGR